MALPPPPVTTAASTAARGWLALQIAGGMVATMGQTLVVLRTHQGHPVTDVAVALVPAAVLFFPLVLLPALLPSVWARHGAATAAATRLAFSSLPHVRGARGAYKVLQGQPSSGGGLAALGKDLFVLTVGTRCLVIAGLAFLTAVSTPVPLLADLALQLYAMRRSLDAGLACESPMLTHATWRRRISSIYSVASMLELLTIGVVSPVALGSAGVMEPFRRSSDPERCRVFVRFVGLLHPLVGAILISARLHRGAPGHGEWRTRWRARTRCDQCNNGSSSSAGRHDSIKRLWRRLSCGSCFFALVRHSIAASDDQLEALLSFGWCQGCWLRYLASWWALFSVLWMAALQLPAATA